jgi:hypothetical protein
MLTLAAAAHPVPGPSEQLLRRLRLRLLRLRLIPAEPRWLLLSVPTAFLSNPLADSSPQQFSALQAHQ